MNDEIKKIIEQSTFEVRPGRYVYIKAESLPSTGNHFMVSVDSDEITVVTREENLGAIGVIEKNKDSWVLISLNVSIPFYSIGFLATVSNAIASERMNVLIVSTYSKDYILVRADLANKARETLLALGFSEK